MLYEREGESEMLSLRGMEEGVGAERGVVANYVSLSRVTDSGSWDEQLNFKSKTELRRTHNRSSPRAHKKVQ